MAWTLTRARWQPPDSWPDVGDRTSSSVITGRTLWELLESSKTTSMSGIDIRYVSDFWKSPMRHYRRNSVENWGWPPLLFIEKPLSPPISQKKAKSAGKNFWYWCRKKRIKSENQIFLKKEQKTLQCFLFQNGDYRTPKFLPSKVGHKS